LEVGGVGGCVGRWEVCGVGGGCRGGVGVWWGGWVGGVGGGGGGGEHIMCMDVQTNAHDSLQPTILKYTVTMSGKRTGFM